MLLIEADKILKSIYLQLVEDALNDKPLPTAEQLALECIKRGWEPNDIEIEEAQ